MKSRFYNGVRFGKPVETLRQKLKARTTVAAAIVAGVAFLTGFLAAALAGHAVSLVWMPSKKKVP